METMKFIQEHWKGKLITQGAPHFTLEGFDLSENTIHLLSKVGLPVILPIEKKISFLPFTYLSKIQVRDKSFYIIGDFSPSLSGVALLAIEIGSENMYTISKNHEKEYFHIFMNQSLGQFLMCLAHYNIFEERLHQRQKAYYRQTASEARAEYEALKEQLHNIDAKAIENQGVHWGHCLYLSNMDVEAIEFDEED